MSKLQIGYVGAGFVAQKIHIPNIQSIDECELAALAEVRTGLGKKVQDHFRIPKLYSDHHELAADKDIKAVGVSGHFAVQGEIAADLLKAGKHVFMEKPMAVTVEQAEKIIEAEKESGCRCMVAYMKRYDAGNELVKSLIEQYNETGEMGSLKYVRNHGFCGNWTGGLDTRTIGTDEPYPPAPQVKPEWLPDSREGNYLGYLQQYTHNVNLLRWFLNADDIKIKAVDLDPENGYTGVIILEVGGVRTIIESASIAYHGWDEHTIIYFDKGWIKTCAPPLLLRNKPAAVEVYRTDKQHSKSDLFPIDGWKWSYLEEVRHFVRNVIEDKPFRSPARDALLDVRFFEDLYRKFLINLGEI